jgi:hypothetical protein
MGKYLPYAYFINYISRYACPSNGFPAYGKGKLPGGYIFKAAHKPAYGRTAGANHYNFV